MLADALEHLVRGIVEHPDDVTVRDKQLRRGSILEVRVHPEDLGKVIGRSGRTATAFRTVVGALAGRGGARDRLRGRRPPPLTAALGIADPPTVGLLSVVSDVLESDDLVTTEVVVGRIGKPHGIRGEVSVELRTDEPERRFVVGAALGRGAPRLGQPRRPTR